MQLAAATLARGNGRQRHHLPGLEQGHGQGGGKGHVVGLRRRPCRLVVQRSADGAREQIATQIARLANFPAVSGNVQIRRLQGNELPGLVEESVVLGIQIGVQHGRKAQLGQIRAAVVAQLPDPMPVAIGLLHFGKNCPQAQRRQPFARAGQASVLSALPTGLREHAQALHRHGLRLGLSMLGIDDPKATAAKQQRCAVLVCLAADAVASRLAHGTLHPSTGGALHPACACSSPPHRPTPQSTASTYALAHTCKPMFHHRASMTERHPANVNNCQETPGLGFSMRAL
ncbi:hypothetical protein, partial [Vandammella animalimorsus]|uniref:hypothetical protein n=1 Tax=Vandammella animalimorsus TaxID=2029117 RepID=UPI001EEE70C5